MKAIIVLSAAAMTLGGCASGGRGAMEDAALVGSFAGAGAPGKNAGLAAIGNGLIGGPIGSALDPSDRRLALEAEYQALEYTQAGQTVSWTGTSNSSSGQVVAYQPYRVGSQDCRQYMHVVSIGQQSRTAKGAACRNDDGSWTPLT